MKEKRSQREEKQRAAHEAAKQERMRNPSGTSAYATRVKRREERQRQEAKLAPKTSDFVAESSLYSGHGFVRAQGISLWRNW
jgi:hypothetical protein